MAELWLALVVTSAICGALGYAFAKKTGRNPAVWIVLGIVCNVFVLVFLPRVKRRRLSGE
jgi:drug/metabolite transporter (DMT)-like permease